MQSALTRHLTRAHRDQIGVQNVLSLTGKDRIQAFSLLKKEGIFQENQRMLKEKRANAQVIGEKNHETDNSDKVSTRGYCKGTYASGLLAKHMQNCGAIGETTEYVALILIVN